MLSISLHISLMRTSSDTKVILVGDISVGKSSLLMQFEKQQFDEKVEPTIGANFITRLIETSHGPINLMVWDTAGQERYRALIPMYSRNAAAALLVIDVSCPQSFESIDLWHATIKQNCLKNCKIYLVANKIDLECRVPLDKVEDWARQNGCEFFKTSARDRSTVDPVFMKVAEDLASDKAKPQRQAVPIAKPRTEQNSCC